LLASTISDPLVQLTSFQGPVPTAEVTPNPEASALLSHSIEVNWSAKNGMKAPKGDSSVTRTFNRSTASTLVICPQLALVRLGFSASKARSMVYFTSAESKSEPSWHLMPSLSTRSTVLPSALTVHSFARFPIGAPESSNSSSES
jgi:hypothetical protein